MPRFVFVTGGVLSSLGKGIFAASTAKLLKARGVKVSAMKIDPYLNGDAGTLNPYEHGECFVTRDGHECDLDLGNYERFLDEFAVREQNLMMGQVYRAVVEKERRGDFLGKTVQTVPHVTDEIVSRIQATAKITKADVLVVEVGGTVGDIESEVVLEAARKMKYEGTDPVYFIHLALVPTIITGEQKTKPLQHSVRALLARGIVPDFIVARSEKTLSDSSRQKIHMLTGVPASRVVCSPNVGLLYELPMELQKQGYDVELCKLLGVPVKDQDLKDWRALMDKHHKATQTVRVGVVGKYAYAKDAYNSVFEAITHSGIHNGVKTDAMLIDSVDLEKPGWEKIMKGLDAIVIPGGFGARGIEGKINAIHYARKNNVPLLGLCYGLQLSVIEVARNELGFKDAHTTEINPDTKHPVIDMLPEQKAVQDKGGTMRLGAKDVLLKKGTQAAKLYAKESREEKNGPHISKRFRHRYEVNPEFVAKLEKAGLVFSGQDPARPIMKVLEMPKLKFFMGTQYHPEFDSRLERPEPLFLGLIAAAKK